MSEVNGGFSFLDGDNAAITNDDGGFGFIGVADGLVKTDYELVTTAGVVSDDLSLGGSNPFIQPLESVGLVGSYAIGINPVSSSSFDLMAPTYNDPGFLGSGGVEQDNAAVSVEMKAVGSQQQRRQSFENSLITLNDISNYRASGLDWMETGVSNWLSFDQGGSLGIAENPTCTTPSVNMSTSSMYNFYDEDENECQKELDEMNIGPQLGDSTTIAVEGLHGFTLSTTECKSADDSDSEDDEEDSDDDEDKSEESDHFHENDMPNGCDSSRKAPVPKRSETCTLCNVTFPTPGRFEKHMKAEHKEDYPYPCSSCDKKFAKFFQRAAHQKIHDPDRYKGVPEWECALCDRKYHVRVSLYAHYKTSHPGEKPCRKPVQKQLIKVQYSGKKVVKLHKKSKKFLQRKNSCTKSTSSIEATVLVNTQPQLEQDDLMEAVSASSEFIPTSVIPETPEQSAEARPGHYPCTVCGKVFNCGFSLREHQFLHTGEKPHKCAYCDAKFRLRQTLTYHVQRRHRTKEDTRNIMKLYKCRVCGKDDIFMFQELHNHRTRKHQDVPYDKEREKTFGCGVCLKPYFLREDAIVCALLAHDPTPLHETMFKYKCPACPKKYLGYYKLAYLRKHWDEEHPEKKLPTKLNKASNLDDITLKEEALPTIRVNKYKAQEIRENGLPKGITFECPLYIDLTEFGPSEQEGHLMASLIVDILSERGPPGSDGPQICTLCGKELSNRGNLKRHLTSVHISAEMLKKDEEEKNQKGEENVRKKIPMYAKPSTNEVEDVFNSVLSNKRKVMDSEGENDSQHDEKEVEPGHTSSFQCKFCDKTFNKKRALQFHEVRGHINPKRVSSGNSRPLPCSSVSSRDMTDEESDETSSNEEASSREEATSSSEEETDPDDEKDAPAIYKTVNINDANRIRDLLNYRTVSVVLSRITHHNSLPNQPAGTDELNVKELKELPLVPPKLVKREMKTEPEGGPNPQYQPYEIANGHIHYPTQVKEEEEEEGDSSGEIAPVINRRRSAAAVLQKTKQDATVPKRKPKVVLRRIEEDEKIKISLARCSKLVMKQLNEDEA